MRQKWLGCMAVGGDTATHYFAYRHFVAAVRELRLREPTWSGRGFGKGALLQRFLGEERIQVDALWRYLPYSIYNQSRHAAAPCASENVQLALRAQVRSLTSRSARAADLFGIV